MSSSQNVPSITCNYGSTRNNQSTQQHIKKRMKWKKSKNKISAHSNSYEDGGLKNVDVFKKVISLQCSWIKRLYDENFPGWKIIPSYLMKTIFCEHFKFHPCLEPSIKSLKNEPNFYKEMITN